MSIRAFSEDLEERIASRLYIAAMQTTSNESDSFSVLKMSFGHLPPWGFTGFICFSLYLVGSSFFILGFGTSNSFLWLHLFICLILHISLSLFSSLSHLFSPYLTATSKPTKVLCSKGPFTLWGPPPLKAVVAVYYPEIESQTIFLFLSLKNKTKQQKNPPCRYFCKNFHQGFQLVVAGFSLAGCY